MTLLSSLPQGEWWELVPAVIGAIIGALAGGVPSYLLAIRATRENLKKDIELRQQTDDERCFRLFLVLRDMLNDTTVSKRHIDEMLSRPVEHGDRFPNQRRISAFANLEFRSFVKLNLNDLSIFRSQEGLIFLTKLMECTERYNSILDSMRVYSHLKKEAADFILTNGQHTVGDDGFSSTVINSNLRGHIDLLDSRLEGVIKPTVEFLNELLVDLLSLAREFDARVRSDLGRKVKSPSFDQDELSSLIKTDT